MIIKVLIITLILVAFMVLALGVKLLFDPNAEFSAHSCGIDNGKPNEDGACSICQLKDLSDCAVEKDSRDKK